MTNPTNGGTVDAPEEVEQEVIDESQAAEIRAQLPAVRESEALVARGEMTAQELVGQAGKIKEVMALAMRPNVHYGIIPGTGTKPSLLKPGAETLCVLFRFAPTYETDKTFRDDGHLIVSAKVRLVHIPTGLTIAEGEGMCTTLEEKYAKRNGQLLCPECQQPEVRKSKDRDEFYCWRNPSRNANGCGAKFASDDTRITSQTLGKIDNPNLPDTYNTVLKMANKRALVAAILNGTAASDIFTHDVDDPEVAEQIRQTQQQPTTVPAPQRQSAAPTGERPPPRPGGNVRLISDPQKGAIQALKKKLIEANAFTEEQWYAALQAEYDVDSTTKLTSQEASKLIDRLKAAEAKLAGGS